MAAAPAQTSSPSFFNIRKKVEKDNKQEYRGSVDISCKEAKFLGGKYQGACNWKITNPKGSGDFSTVYEACCNCDFVAKIAKPVKLMDEASFVAFVEKEVRIQRKAASLGIALPVAEAWYCPSKREAVIIMPSADTTLGDKLCSVPITLEVVKKYMTEIVRLINTLHAVNISHNDLHLNNIMWIERERKFVIIDFGLATETSKIENVDIVRVCRTMLKRIFRNCSSQIVQGQEKLIEQYLYSFLPPSWQFIPGGSNESKDVSGIEELGSLDVFKSGSRGESGMSEFETMQPIAPGTNVVRVKTYKSKSK